MRLGIIGGTFNPIHYGHLFIAEEAKERFQLERVVFIPNGQPPHKPGLAITSATHRFAMTQIAITGNAGFTVSPVEVQRAGPSYTVDTLASLRQQNPDADLFYITGVDAVAEVLTWNRHEEVIQMVTFLAATRPGFDLMTLKEKLPPEYLGRILLLGSTFLGISSTDIRERIRQGHSARYLTPDSVLNYIQKYKLYFDDVSEQKPPAAKPGKDA